MDKAWLDAENAKIDEQIAQKKQQIIDFVKKQKYMTESDKADFIRRLTESVNNDDQAYMWSRCLIWNIIESIDSAREQPDFDCKGLSYTHLLDASGCEELENLFKHRRSSYLLDSEPVHMSGTIIITDPCYIKRPHSDDAWKAHEEHEEDAPKFFEQFMRFKKDEYPDAIEFESDLGDPRTLDYDYPNPIHLENSNGFRFLYSKMYGEDYEAYQRASAEYNEKHPDPYDGIDLYELSQIGLTSYISRDTIYGDWGCMVFNADTKEAIGEFCADSGMVAVMLLDEVLKYNPEFNYHTERKWTTATIEDFNGDVHTEVIQSFFEYDGKQHEDFSVRIVGHGINTRTGKPINFITSQTSL